MENSQRPKPLPPSFEARYVVGDVLRFLPAIWAIVALGWFIGSRNFYPLLVGMHLFMLGFVVFLSVRKANSMRREVETLAMQGYPFIPENARSHFVPLFGAILILAIIRSITKHDARWAIIVGALGALLGIGLFLRWFIFERWLQHELRKITPA